MEFPDSNTTNHITPTKRCFESNAERPINHDDFQIMSSPMKMRLYKGQNDVPMRDNTHEFTQLFVKLANLLNELHAVYNEIGFSKDEIQTNERLLFESISRSFDKFLDESLSYRDALKTENTRIVSTLRKILLQMGDNNGTMTIPDLYLRNLIINSNEDDSTLLNRRKSLDASKRYVLRSYRERLLKFIGIISEFVEMSSKLGGYGVTLQLNLPELCDMSLVVDKIKCVEDPVDIFPIIANDSMRFLQEEPFDDLSDQRFRQLESALLELTIEAKSRIEKISDLSTRILGLWRELHIEDHSDHPIIAEKVKLYSEVQEYDSNIDISMDVISNLTRLVEDLGNTKRQREELLDDYRTKCEVLWMTLKQDSNFADTFKQENSTLSLDAIQNYSKEISRLQELKKAHINDFVQDARRQIEHLWDLLSYSKSERAQFRGLYSSDFSDDLLELHENEIERLTKKYEALKPLMDSIELFRQLMQDKQKLEEGEKDSSRLLQRNSHKILMEEEKLRKRLNRRIPKAVSELRHMINQFENHGSISFLSEDVLNQLNEQQQLLESKGRRIGSVSVSASRAPSRQSSRASSRAPSRASSRVPSRITSPVKLSITKEPPSCNSSIPRLSSSVQKPASSFKRPTLRIHQTPRLTPSTSFDSDLLKSSTKIDTAPMASTARRIPVNNPGRLSRSLSAYQPQLSKLQELPTDFNEKSAFCGSPLRSSNIINTSVTPKGKPRAMIITSPLKSLRKDVPVLDDKENVDLSLSADDDDGYDAYSSWREEQLRKLNSGPHSQ